MQELMDLFLKKSKEKHSNIIYAQAYKNGILKAEYKLFPVKTRLNVWSVSKPFVAMAAGIAEKEGIIKRAESIYADFQQYIPEDGKYTRNIEKITVENLLTMSSGLKEPLFFCDDPLRYQVKDWIRYYFTAGEFVHEPGTHFLYSNFNTYILSCLLEMRTGENLLNYLRDRLFEPNGLYLTIDELAHFGHLLLYNGDYSRKQVVPSSYVSDACRKQIDNQGKDEIVRDYESYGYGYFIRMAPIPGAVLLGGNYGQYCMVYPKEKAVLCVMSLDGNDHTKIRNDLVDAAAEYYGIAI